MTLDQLLTKETLYDVMGYLSVTGFMLIAVALVVRIKFSEYLTTDTLKSCIWVIVGVGAMMVASGSLLKPESVRLEKAAKCQRDIQCIAPRMIEKLGSECADRIKRSIAYPTRWTNGRREPLFSRAGWSRQDLGFLVLHGDKLESAVEGAASQNLVYQCVVSVRIEMVIVASAQVGVLH